MKELTVAYLLPPCVVGGVRGRKCSQNHNTTKAIEVFPGSLLN